MLDRVLSKNKIVSLEKWRTHGTNVSKLPQKRETITIERLSPTNSFLDPLNKTCPWIADSSMLNSSDFVDDRLDLLVGGSIGDFQETSSERVWDTHLTRVPGALSLTLVVVHVEGLLREVVPINGYGRTPWASRVIAQYDWIVLKWYIGKGYGFGLFLLLGSSLVRRIFLFFGSLSFVRLKIHCFHGRSQIFLLSILLRKRGVVAFIW